MPSRYVLLNLLLPALAAVNLLLAWRGVALTDVPGPASLPRVLLRAAAFLHLGLSIPAFLTALALFAALELGPGARGCRRLLARWSGVRPGQSPEEVRRQLGTSGTALEVSALDSQEEHWVFPLHPLGPLDEGCLAFSRGEAPRLLRKSPEDDVAERIRRTWWPQGYTRARLIDLLRGSAGPITLLGLLLLAVASLLPIGPGGRWTSWTLYLPVLGAAFGAIYESTVRKGWRFDLLLVYPLQAVVAGGGLVRVVLLLRS